MNLLSKFAERLRPGPERTVISQPLIVPHNNSMEPTVTQKDIEFLKALKPIYWSEPLRSFGLKLYPGEFDERLGRVTSEKCRSRRCLDCEPTLVAVHHVKRELQLFGCSTRKDFLIKVVQGSSRGYREFS